MQTRFTFLEPAYPGCPGKEAVAVLVVVVVVAVVVVVVIVVVEVVAAAAAVYHGLEMTHIVTSPGESKPPPKTSKEQLGL